MSSDNRCKFCAVRDIFRCPHQVRDVTPQNEIRNCKHFRPKSRGLPPEQKKHGSLGGG